MKQVHAWSILQAFNPQVFDCTSGIAYEFFSAEPRVLFISAGNCFHFRWYRCFLRHEQTDWAESIQNYFLSLKIGNVWAALGCLCTFPTLHPAWSCAPPLPQAVWDFLYLWSMSCGLCKEKVVICCQGIITRTELAKILQTKNVPVTFQMSIFKMLKGFNNHSVQKQWYWSLHIK